MRLFITIIFFSLIASAAAGSPVAEDILRQVDYAIEHKEEYLDNKELEISRLSSALDAARTDAERWEAVDRLYKACKAFSIDSLVRISRVASDIAARLDNDTARWRATLMEVEALKGMANYNRALRVLDSLPPEAREQFRSQCLSRYCSIYYSLYANTWPRNEAEDYRIRLLSYRDSLIDFHPEGHPNRYINLAERARVSGRPEEAIAIIDGMLSQELSAPVDTSVVMFIKAQAFLAAGAKDSAKVYLAHSALNDLRQCSRKYEALQTLAGILSDEGDTKRAYRYIMCSIDDIQKCNARSRLPEIIESMPIISRAHDQTTRQSARNRTILFLTASIAAVILLMLLMLLWRRQLILRAERHTLSARNLELTRLKEELASTNMRLEESTKVKEEYIGYLFNLCSEYIDSMEKFRLQLMRKLKTGKVSDIESALTSSLSAPYLKSFFEKFDSIFLDLFPDFIERFNSLMKPGQELEPREGELLSPELRIYALVRLGINDSTKNAAFLHYSVQTVYNYRLKVRNRSTVDKSDFVRRVQSL